MFSLEFLLMLTENQMDDILAILTYTAVCKCTYLHDALSTIWSQNFRFAAFSVQNDPVRYRCVSSQDLAIINSYQED